MSVEAAAEAQRAARQGNSAEWPLIRRCAPQMLSRLIGGLMGRVLSDDDIACLENFEQQLARIEIHAPTLLQHLESASAALKEAEKNEWDVAQALRCKYRMRELIADIERFRAPAAVSSLEGGIS